MSGGWAELGLPPEVGQGWLSGGAVCGFQPHASMQALQEVLAEGDSGGRLLGCSPNVAMLLAAKIKRDREAQRSASTSPPPATPPKGAGGGGGRVGGLPLPGGGGGAGGGRGAGDLRCDVMYSLAPEKPGGASAVTFASAEIEAVLGKVSKAEAAFAGRLQALVEQHESELLIADAASDGGGGAGGGGGGLGGDTLPGIAAARHEAAALSLESRLHALMHSYVGGLLVVAGTDCGVGGSGDVAGSMKSSETWITAGRRGCDACSMSSSRICISLYAAGHTRRALARKRSGAQPWCHPRGRWLGLWVAALYTAPWLGWVGAWVLRWVVRRAGCPGRLAGPAMGLTVRRRRR